MLLKWRKEKELKKKTDMSEQAKKKPFRVVHIDTETYPFQKFTQPLKVCWHSFLSFYSVVAYKLFFFAQGT